MYIHTLGLVDWGYCEHAINLGQPTEKETITADDDDDGKRPEMRECLCTELVHELYSIHSPGTSTQRRCLGIEHTVRLQPARQAAVCVV